MPGETSMFLIESVTEFWRNKAFFDFSNRYSYISQVIYYILICAPSKFIWFFLFYSTKPLTNLSPISSHYQINDSVTAIVQNRSQYNTRISTRKYPTSQSEDVEIEKFYDQNDRILKLLKNAKIEKVNVMT